MTTHGFDRRKKAEPIHPWRWRGLIVWILIFTVITFLSLRSLEDQSVKVSQLQKTNCGLTKFLLTARRTRWDAYRQNHHKVDLEAVKGYEQLAMPFLGGKRHESIGNCKIPHILIIAARPYDHLR